MVVMRSTRCRARARALTIFINASRMSLAFVLLMIFGRHLGLTPHTRTAQRQQPVSFPHEMTSFQFSSSSVMRKNVSSPNNKPTMTCTLTSRLHDTQRRRWRRESGERKNNQIFVVTTSTTTTGIVCGDAIVNDEPRSTVSSVFMCFSGNILWPKQASSNYASNELSFRHRNTLLTALAAHKTG